MSDTTVRVESIDALKMFRVALFKFVEMSNTALNDVEGDLQSTLNWLENEQLTYWQGQIRKRTDLVGRAKEALRMKRIFKDSVGRTPAAIDEEKALHQAQVRLVEAEEKLVNVKRYTRLLQKEIQTYKGSIQRFVTTLQSDIPVAISALDGMVDSLEAYVSLAPADASGVTPVESTAPAPPPSASEDPAA